MAIRVCTDVGDTRDLHLWDTGYYCCRSPFYTEKQFLTEQAPETWNWYTCETLGSGSESDKLDGTNTSWSSKNWGRAPPL